MPQRFSVPRVWWFGIALLSLAVFVRVALVGYATTAYLLAALAVGCIGWHTLRHRKAVRMVFLSLAIIGLVLLLIAEIPVLIASRGDTPNDAPYLVVLGAGVNGTTPSLSLVNRLTAAKDYLDTHPDTVVIVSGGQGEFEDIPESEAMYVWLTAHGIAPERIVQENKSTSTRENLEFSFHIICARGDNPADGVAIVSSEYHLYRAKCIAKEYGAVPYGVAGRTTLPLLRANYFAREAFAVWQLWLQQWLG